jgi:hypothetical protein
MGWITRHQDALIVFAILALTALATLLCSRTGFYGMP